MSDLNDMNCRICKKRMWELKDKIVCEACDSVFHLACANVQESFLQALVENSIKWACGQCVKRKRMCRSVSEAPREATEHMADLKHFLEKLRNDLTTQIDKVCEEQKQLETDLGKSLETCHQKLDENLLLLRDQAKTLERQQDLIDELKVENLTLKETIRELTVDSASSNKNELIVLDIAK